MIKTNLILLTAIVVAVNGHADVLEQDQPTPFDEPSPIQEGEEVAADLEDIYLDPDAVHVILEALHRATLSSQITSPIVSVEKRMGDSFKTGDVLVKLDDTIYRASLKKALATVKQSELTLKAREQLFEGRVGSMVELREAQTQHASAEADLAIARKQLEAATITAPYHGRIVDVYVHDFELAEALEPLLDIIGDEILLARMIIDSSMLNRVNIGSTIEIYFPEANVTVPAVIKRIGAEIDPASATIRVDAELENKDYKLTSGMNGMTILSKVKNYSALENKIVPQKEEPGSAEQEESLPYNRPEEEKSDEKEASFKTFLKQLDQYDLSNEQSSPAEKEESIPYNRSEENQKPEKECDPEGCKLKPRVEEKADQIKFEQDTAFEAFLKELDQYDLSKIEGDQN